MCKCEACGLEYNIPNYDCDEIVHHCPEQQNKEPTLIEKAGNFTKSLIKHVTSGSVKLSQEIIDERYRICSSNECGFFKAKEGGGGVCTHNKCGCNLNTEDIIFNKLSWSTQECPVGFWHKVE